VNVLIFGASGMIGQGVLRECLLDGDVASVVSIVRRASGQQHRRLREIVHQDFLDYSGIEKDLTGLDACFFCLGVSSVGMAEAEYTRITHDFTMAAADTLVRLNPAMAFVYVSGLGTDSSERGRTMWARVKGKTENDLLKLPFKAAYMFRPGFIAPMHGIKARNTATRAFYALTGPLLPWAYRHWPKHVTTTEQLGRAMLKAARQGAAKKILETVDINGL
jgi:uncharacterized protein YbjT (DUF2867 family)